MSRSILRPKADCGIPRLLLPMIALFATPLVGNPRLRNVKGSDELSITSADVHLKNEAAWQSYECPAVESWRDTAPISLKSMRRLPACCSAGGIYLAKSANPSKRSLPRGWVPDMQSEFASPDALHLALRAVGVSAGDAVLTVSMTAVATVSAIVQAQATPVFIDIDPATYTMSPKALQDALSSWSLPQKFSAILPVPPLRTPGRYDSA